MQLIEYLRSKGAPATLLDRVSFEHINVNSPSRSSLINSQGESPTHVYSYCLLFSERDRFKLIQALNGTNWEVVAFSINKHKAQ